ncbi:hypothetical protein Gohar_024520 [Gossypium harknessii]|uniref:Uncharacterized protein n=1 Tax=Gossypium harknessii TaxID=34285 RepID=A0A7J9HG61_9ROSI|nr:hypothetical protein [Gossypium harknessii]
MDNRWLRTVDGTPCNLDNLGNFNQGNLSYEGNVLGRNVREGIGSQNINPNLRQAGSGKYKESSSYNLGYDGGMLEWSPLGLDMDLWICYRMWRRTLLLWWKVRKGSVS